MKSNFAFLEKFSVNLGSKFGMKESRDQIFQSEVNQSFKKFAQLFCQIECEHLLDKSTNVKLIKARQFIEKEKVDSFSGILDCLLNNKHDVSDEILNAYQLVQNSSECTPVEKINYIYVNVGLSCTKKIEEPFHRLITLLCSCLEHPAPNITLPLNFMAVLLLWPQRHFSRKESYQLQGYIAILKNAFHTEMRPFYNGKKAIVHFFLGRKSGYHQIVHLREIKSCINAENELFASQWENGAIWRNPKVKELLCRVTGKVKSNSILAQTSIPDLNVELPPLFQSQLQGFEEGSTVSCFIGFSIQGPLAIDIDKATLFSGKAEKK